MEPPRPNAPAHTLNEWFTPWRFAGLLMLLFGVCFAPVLVGTESFANGDYGQFAYPIAFHARECLRQGELPLWNPLSSCGIPFLAQWNTMSLYPLSLLYVLLPMPWSLGVFGIGHLFLGAMGMYFLAHRWTGNRLCGAVAGTVFGFNGLMWYGLAWPHLIAALGWMPWVVLTTQVGWEKGGRWFIAAALVGAMQMLTGGAEAIVQTWLAGGILCALRIAGAECAEQPLLSVRVKVLGRFAGIVLLVAGLAAVQLLPFLELVSHSQRASSYGASAVSTLESMPLSGWANFIAPLFHCTKNAQGIYVQPAQTWTASFYLAIGAMALAAYAFCFVRNARALVLGFLGLLAILLAMGPRALVYDWVRHFAPLSLVRFPVKFVMLVIFAVPLLAALGLARFQSAAGENWTRESKRLGAVAIVLLLASGAILWMSWKQPVASGELSVVAINIAVRVCFLLLTLGCIVGLKRGHPLLQVVLVLLIWFDVFTHAPNLTPTVPSEALKPDRARDYFGWEAPDSGMDSRLMLSPNALLSVLRSGSEEPQVDLDTRRLTFEQNLNLLDHVAKFDGFYSCDVSEYLDLFARVYFTTNPCEPLKNFLGISRVSNATNFLQWAPRESALPLVTAGQAPRFVSKDEALQRVLSSQFDPQHIVYLPEEARETIQAAGVSNATVQVMEGANESLALEVEAPSRTMVMVAQVFFEPWKAAVDGVATRLWKANYAFQALEVPAGKHRVTLNYHDRALSTGAIISLLSAVTIVALWIRFQHSERVGSREG